MREILSFAKGITADSFSTLDGDPIPTTPKTVAEGHRKGVDGFTIWDMDGGQDDPEWWEWVRRIGHREETESWDKHISTCRTISLKTLNSLDAAQGLEAAVYSGG